MPAKPGCPLRLESRARANFDTAKALDPIEGFLFDCLVHASERRKLIQRQEIAWGSAHSTAKGLGIEHGHVPCRPRSRFEANRYIIK